MYDGVNDIKTFGDMPTIANKLINFVYEATEVDTTISTPGLYGYLIDGVDFVELGTCNNVLRPCVSSKPAQYETSITHVVFINVGNVTLSGYLFVVT
jgi:hypothetical protein